MSDPTDPILTTAESNGRPPLPPPPADRYRLADEIARGGMGAVHRATDTVLGREVAVKVLLDRFEPGSSVARRFREEAAIAGQLQHPGIPPVHDLGTLPDGRPFLAMKLIKGRTLDEQLTARADVSADRGRFVSVFEKVCEAVGYAHAHGVVHRDLKPANVMVGSFGEAQVMDWGLAKVLAKGDAPRADETDQVGTHIRTQRDGADDTQAGSLLGTPAFMAPEQAAGAVRLIDARADVFGLGGILCVILAGRPPFTGPTSEDVRQKAALGQVGEAFAALDACGADPELVGLCKRCLAADRFERPADGGAVAKNVTDIRAAADERARQAEISRVKAEGDRLAAEAWAAERWRRVQFATAVGLLMLGIGGVYWWQSRQAAIERNRLVRNGEAVAALLDQAEKDLQVGNAIKAAAALDAAASRAMEGGTDVYAERQRLLASDLAVTRELSDVDQFRWTPVRDMLPTASAVTARYRDVLGRFAVDPDEHAIDDVTARISNSTVRNRLVAALDRLLADGRSARVRSVLHVVDPDAFLGSGPASGMRCRGG